jgi:hypothetical protein
MLAAAVTKDTRIQKTQKVDRKREAMMRKESKRGRE